VNVLFNNGSLFLFSLLFLLLDLIAGLLSLLELLYFDAHVLALLRVFRFDYIADHVPLVYQRKASSHYVLLINSYCML
jgi:hypothetical protein